ncbi:hypothetical protein ACFE04_023254 [Oxalis oulophora]
MNVQSETETETETEYHSKDFEWETLKHEIENNPCLQYHFLPHQQQQQQHIEQQQLENNDDSKAWQRFHIRHSSGKFFKERRYLLKEFPELVTCGDQGSKVLEVGCGNGSTVLPILRGNKNVRVYACDCSTETLKKVEQFVGATDIASVKERFHPFYCDFSSTCFPKWLACESCLNIIPESEPDCVADLKNNDVTHSNSLSSLEKDSCCIRGVDIITMIFTLSAVPFQRMPVAIEHCFSVLKPGGLLLFRDYGNDNNLPYKNLLIKVQCKWNSGLYDMTMLRFEPHQRVGPSEYMRADGTRSYFFCLDTVRDLFFKTGFLVLELEYCCVESVNRRKGKSMRRVWVHGKFQKPL